MALQFNAATLPSGDQFKGYDSQADATGSFVDHTLPQSGIFQARPVSPKQAGHDVPEGSYPITAGSYGPGELRPIGVASGLYHAAAEGTRVDSVFFPYTGFTGHTHLNASGITHSFVTNPPVSGIVSGWPAT
jgi:hypothetical protein